MRSHNWARVLCILLVLCMMAAGYTYASEEPAEGSSEWTEEDPAAESPAETELPAEGPGESAEEEPAPQAEAPVSVEEDGDPMALRMALQLDGGSKTFSDFTPRALNGETLRKGVDVSAWQSGINWKKAAADGIEFAIIRAAYRTYGSSGALYKDSYFDANIRGAKAAGIRVGVYIFSQAITVQEAQEEADYLLSLVKDYDIDLPLVFDFEYVSGGRLKSSLGRRTSTDICNAFCERVEAAGYESMVYANASTLSGNLYPTEFKRVWLAHYTKKTSYSASDYEYWQCSASGDVSGISGDTDIDFWFEPIAQVQVTPTPQPPDPLDPDCPFTDVSSSDWFYDAVKQAYQSRIVSGVTASTFQPNGQATRGQFVTMIYRLQGQPDWETEAAFTDLTQDYYKPAVYWAAENAIVSGYSDESFGPARPITREEIVTILYRMEGTPEVSGTLDAFSDGESVQAYARSAMAWAVENGIISGYEDQTLRPQNYATRAEVCRILTGFAAL